MQAQKMSEAEDKSPTRTALYNMQREVVSSVLPRARSGRDGELQESAPNTIPTAPPPAWMQEWCGSMPGTVALQGPTALQRCGVTEADDVFLLKEDDLRHAGLNIIEARRIMACVDEMRALDSGGGEVYDSDHHDERPKITEAAKDNIKVKITYSLPKLTGKSPSVEEFNDYRAGLARYMTSVGFPRVMAQLIDPVSPHQGRLPRP